MRLANLLASSLIFLASCSFYNGNNINKIPMPNILEVEGRCKRYSNFGNQKKELARLLIGIDLDCNKVPGSVYENSSVSVVYLICNKKEILAERIPFGIYFKKEDRLYVDSDRDGFIDYIKDGQEIKSMHEDAPSCSKNKSTLIF